MFSLNKKGFTLIELLIVIAIIAILAAVIIANTTGAQVQARDSRRIQELDSLRSALEMYYNVNAGHYPYTGDCAAGQTPGMHCCTVSPTVCDFTKMATLIKTKGYISVTPVDPGTSAYEYCASANGSGYVLKASLENNNQSALSNDYDGTGYGTCTCTGDGTGPYIYCLRNP